MTLIDNYDGFKNPFTNDTFDLVNHISYLYSIFNKEQFDRCVTTTTAFKPFVELIYNTFKQDLPHFIIKDDIINKHEINSQNTTVLLGFSGGLDSVYQALKLKENDIPTILYHVKNINLYENGQSAKVVNEFSNKSGIGCVVVDYKNPAQYKKQIPENPIKNQFIISMMLHYCIVHDIKTISMGDPFNLPITDATPGINLTDANEITDMFLDIVKNNYVIGFDYKSMIDYKDKLQEFNYLKSLGYDDCFYSCITAGRFNQHRHKQIEDKYNITLPKYSCGCYCRKCGTLLLLQHYDDGIEYPQELIDRCWKILYNNGYSSEYFQFNPDISLEQRIKNLHTT